MADTIVAAPYTGLMFSFSEMLKEIRAMRALAAPFLDKSSASVWLEEWQGKLENFRRDRRNGSLRWEIPQDRAIRTIVSPGDYQADGKGRYSVYGTLSSLWCLSHQGKHKILGRTEETFMLSGNASILLQVVDAGGQPDPPRTLARWTMDIGVTDSPGCHFHEQVTGADKDQHFPTGLDVPRFPTYLITPMDSLEFLLGELFQDRWKEHVVKNASTNGWKTIQKRRLLKSLEWHYRVVLQATASPWVSLKSAKPSPKVLVGEDCGWR